MAVIWLSYILSQADHRLNHVQAWAAKRLETLRACVSKNVSELDLTDERQIAVLRYLDLDTQWQELEEELGGSLVRVYDIKPERVRLDSTTASSHCGIDEEGLFQWGGVKIIVQTWHKSK